MSAVNWTAFGGVAQILAAVATIGLAVFTAFLAKSTHHLSRDTKNLAKEAETDRQLAFRPQLSVMFPEPSPTGDMSDMQIRVLNAGNGPALSCKIIARLTGEVTRSATCAVGDLIPSGPTDHFPLPFKAGDVSAGIFDTSGSHPDSAPDVAIFCTDILNRRWRFLVKLFVRAGPTWSIGKPAEWIFYPGEEAPRGGSAAQPWSTNSDLFGPG